MKDLDEMPAQCPTTEVLAVYLDHNLTSKDRALIEKHLIACNKCRHIVSESLKAEDAIVLAPDRDMK